MKKISKYLLIIIVVLYSSACDSNFDELNTNKVSATSIDPAFQLNAAIVGCAFPNGSLVYDVGVVQQIISPNSGLMTGANFNQDNRTLTQELWQGYYRNVIKNTRDVISQVEEDPSRANLKNMTRIIQAFAFMVLTDEYGSIPYFEGGKGYSDQIYLPVYDSQEAIYADLIKELTEATSALDVTGTVESADILYGGDLNKWKSFGYSLLLRAGMRLSEADPTKAAQVAQTAVQGGVILMNEDNATINHDPNYTNPIGNFLNATEASNFYLTEPFVDYLRSKNDPRLAAIAVTYVGAKSGPEQIPENQTYDAAVHVGIPMGNDNAGAVEAANELGLASFYEFAQADRRRITKNTAPNFLITASQNYLLMAEARQRGWISSGSVEEYYNAGVRAHMNQLGIIDEGSSISPAEITQYLNENPFDPSMAMEQINTQYWVSCFLNGPEAFANFRRTGYPALSPNPYPGREVEFINRLTYPNSEISVNAENVSAAIASQGPDDLGTKVWWDK
ncbi:SusD/RagB family nutrient-binding outer membrane lipoprotein [Algoriphagus halophytocola]|uniref:SusD/RagB family nutrient-binding outer membrane lipoprotein n=1 Tax=Algoriphagus halophytocola TaxID=2991499 RepID=A0ABY6MIX9_9BACT|nr:MULTISPECIES: SusD/RagB family nutrient-binding outer membrane lipoprotein [unclassified Algoriphagus]UZD22621.1 SusD/RagB family nutrient-binding outer membrane lipoprotein [Algoriphagus sp. TR-M5]WBL43887.1 SusD/RagB family nutrient-binding outer membrane lipoprotein [Algoriphagus sp. TR-M9]